MNGFYIEFQKFGTIIKFIISKLHTLQVDLPCCGNTLYTQLIFAGKLVWNDPMYSDRDFGGLHAQNHLEMLENERCQNTCMIVYSHI